MNLIKNDLQKCYLEIFLKTSIFIFGITGAIVSYHFSNASKLLAELNLCLPLIMNAGFAYLCSKGVSFANILGINHEILSEELGVIIAFTFGPLHKVLWLFAVLCALASIGLGVILLTDVI